MSSVIDDPNGRKRILFFNGSGERKSVRLGKCSKHDAERIASYIEDINAAKIRSGAMAGITAAWLGTLGDILHNRLARAGLVAARAAAERMKLGPFIDAYIASRPDVKPNTLMNMKQVRQWLVEHFGESRDMRSITPGDAEAWRESMQRGGLGENTIRRHIGRARQLFKAAIRRGVVQGQNPLEGMTATVRSDKARMFFVTRDMAAKVLEACPDAQWRLLFALSRYGGLRCPSEHLALKWADVDWERNRIRVPSPKTEHHEGGDCRIIPLFPELRPYLLQVFEEADPGTEYVISRYRDRACNLRTHFGRIIRQAGLEVWPKPWHNLRSTRQTELCEKYPIHVVCQWIGNSRAIAQEYYLQVTDAHFESAIAGDEPHTEKAAHNPAQHPHAPGRSTSHDEKKIRVIQYTAAGCDAEREEKYPRQDSNL
jgi:integrase